MTDLPSMEKPLAKYEDINPYTARVYDHPDILVPHPTPAEVRRRLEKLRMASTGGPAPRVIVDLGCGSGNFLVGLAHRYPADIFIGFELRFKRLVRGAEKLEKQGSGNVILMRERAENFAGYFDPDSLDVVYVNFPDPWQKKKQWKKRLVGTPLLETLESLLRPGGVFRFKTDHSGYFLHVLSLTRNRKNMRPLSWSNHCQREASLLEPVRTEFEHLFRARGKQIFRLELEKRHPGD
ncbi:MAG: tRNA (guanosine(46)-N7)-methyltransferase TrmB [Deltaproteobacteria bacterium]|nr:tRNA (guanosine(46)-N7)-methyltransferase TrmB [Deltaproteobacteria bacterium]